MTGDAWAADAEEERLAAAYGVCPRCGVVRHPVVVHDGEVVESFDRELGGVWEHRLACGCPP